MLIPASAFGAFGLTAATDSYTVDTGGGLVFKVRRTDNGVSTQSAGDLMSMVYNGVEYQNTSRGSQLNSGFDYLYTGISAVSVDAAVVNTDYIKVTIVAGNLTHYYMARKGYPHIYMATYFTTEPDTLGLCRFIVRIPQAVLPNGPTPSDIRSTDSTIESGDIFGYSATNANTALIGQTRSKHYSNMRLKDWSYIGATGTNVGVWMLRSNHEGDSGGPFYRSLLNQCGSDQEITYILNYGEAQTEAFRTNILNGPYVLSFTAGATPTTPDTSWVANMGLTGYVATADRGSVACAGISNRDTRYDYTVGFANSAAEYWTNAAATNGAFTKTDILPGTYTMSVYKNELAVYTTSVTVTAGAITTLNPIPLTADPSSTVPLWRIGNWDGTPTEFLNGDKVTTMHPSDVRMSDWNVGTYTVGTSSPATGMPCYQWKGIAGGNQTIQFNLTASQIAASTVKVGITCAYAGGRPNIGVNSWTAGLQGASTQPATRTLTVGTYRGNNTTYTFSVPASALVVGTNNLYLYPISGSGSTGYLSAGYSLDCVELYQGTAQILAVPAAPATVTANGGDTQMALNWSAVSGAASYNVLRSPVSGGPYTVVASALTTASYTDTGLTNNTNYYYVVSTTNSSGTGLNSSEAMGTAALPVPPAAPTGLAAIAYNASTALTWNTAYGATRYKVKRSTTSGSGYVTVKTVATPSYSDFGLINGTTYYYAVSAVNAAGEGPNSTQVSITPISGTTTVTFTSTATLDGHVIASSNTNTAGGTVTSTGTVLTGDSGIGSTKSFQYKGIFSFDTSTIPDSVTIQSATLKLVRSAVSGTSPFTALGTCYADIKGGTGFNASTTLESADFQATADATQVATMSNAASNGAVSTGSLNPTGIGYLNKIGTTQFRVYFSTATNTDNNSDFISWYAGDDATSTNRPVLEITYVGSQAPSSLPVALLPFDETSGTNTADSTGNGWTGTLVNGPTWAAGKVNNAVSIDGVDDHVTLPTGVVSNLGDFTISAWVKLNSVEGWSRIFDFGTGTTNYMFLSPSNGLTNKLRFGIKSTSLAEQIVDGAAPLSSGTWTHVAVSLAGSTATLYVDGVSVGTNTGMTLKPSSLGSTNLNYIGKSQFSSDPYTNGLVDDFQIFNHALTPDEVTLLAAPPATPTGFAAVAGDGQVTLNWTAVTGVYTGYEIRRSLTSDGPYTTIASGITDTSYTDLSVANGTTYYYSVNTLNGLTESSWSTQASVTPVIIVPVTVTLSNLAVNYDGTPKAATVTTTPSGVTVSTTYNGSNTAPTNPGTYTVVSTVTDAGYSGSASGSLVITRVPISIIWTGAVDSNWNSSTANWSLSGANVYYLTGDSVSFTDAGAAASAINLVENVQPAAVIVNGSQNYTLSGTGVIAGAATLSKSGTGTLTLTGGNTFTGATTISGGTLYANRTNAANGMVLSYTSGITINSGGTLRSSSNGLFGWDGTQEHDITVNSGAILTADSGADIGVGLVTLNGGTLANLGASTAWGSWRFDGASDKLSATDNSMVSAVNVKFQNGGSIDVSAGKNLSFTGTITNSTSGGVSAVIKSGSGTLTLSGANTYTGTTVVNLGKLSVTGSLAATTTTITSTAALGGTGSIGGAVTCNGSLAPGVSAGTLTLSAGLVLAATSTLDYDLGTTSDRTAITGNLTLDGTVNVTTAAGFAAGNYTLITYSGALTNNTLNVGTIPAGYTATVNTATTGQVKLIVKATPTINVVPTASPITYGQALSSSTLLGGTASVAGTFAFTTPATVLNAGTASQSVTFTPTDSINYNTVTTSTNVTVNKATPTINIVPTASAITYGQALSSSSLSGGTASVAGAFAFTTPATTPNTGTASQSVTFTPTNSSNYNSATTSASVTVNKATPTVSVAPTASAITYGQALSSSTLSGGTASVAGTFAFTTPTTTPNAGTTSQSVTFTPTNSSNYNTATTSTNVTVNKATAAITLSNLSATYDGTAKSATATTTPAGLTVHFTYDGSTTAPTNAATYTVVATVNDANYVGSASGSLVIAPQASRSYSAWVGEHFTPTQITAGESAATADPDRDGLTNLAEYALGSSPYAFTPQPTVTANASSLSITFQRPAQTNDVIYRAEASPDFTNWTALTLDVLSSGVDPETVRATYTFPSPNPGKQFIRLRFEK